MAQSINIGRTSCSSQLRFPFRTLAFLTVGGQGERQARWHQLRAGLVHHRSRETNHYHGYILLFIRRATEY